MLKRAHHQRARVAAENVFGAVAVMHVEIDDGDALEAMLLERVHGGDGDVVEQAEAHGAAAHRMVPRRAHAAKGAVRLPVQHQVGGKHRRAGRVQRGVPGMRIHRGIRVQMNGAALRRAGADMADVFHRMHPRQAAHVRLRRMVMREVLPNAGGDQLVFDRAQPLRALRVVGAHVVLAAVRVGDKSGSHVASYRVRFAEC